MTTATMQRRQQPHQEPIPPTTASLLAKLADLRNKGGRLAYERVGIAHMIYNDRDWVASLFDGDPVAAAEHIEEEFLGDLCGSLTFSDLLRIREQVPTVEEWEQYRFNLKRLLSLAIDRSRSITGTVTEPGEPTTRRRATLKDMEEAEGTIKALESSRKRDLELIVSKDERIVSLTEKVSQLEKDNHFLRGRIEELQRQLNDMKK